MAETPLSPDPAAALPDPEPAVDAALEAEPEAAAAPPAPAETEPESPAVVEAEPEPPALAETEPESPALAETEPAPAAVVEAEPEPPAVAEAEPLAPLPTPAAAEPPPPPGVALSIPVPALETASEGEGGEWELLLGKLRAWIEEVQLQERWNALGGPLRTAGLLLVALVVLRLYGALLDTLGDLPLLPRLLQLAGLIALLRFSLTRLVRSSERERILSSWRQRWNDFRGDS